MSDRPIEVVGHGGAGADFPGNSLPSFERALQIGVDRVECDLRQARDGTIVLVHDEAVVTPGGTRVEVATLSTAELARVMPDLVTLDDLVEMVQSRAPLMLDVKRPGYEAEVAVAIRRHRLADESSISTTYAITLRRLHAAFPAMRIGLSIRDWSRAVPSAAGHRIARGSLHQLMPLGLPRALSLLGASETMLHHHLVTKHLVDGVHRVGKQVNAWTVDEEEEMQRMVECRVDGIISNRPDHVRHVIRPPGAAGDEQSPALRPG